MLNARDHQIIFKIVTGDGTYHFLIFLFAKNAESGYMKMRMWDGGKNNEQRKRYVLSIF